MSIKRNRIDEIIRETVLNYINESKIDVSKIVFVAFGSSSYDLNKVTPVKLSSFLSTLRNKPEGGVWASPLTSKNGWADYCNSEKFRLQTLSQHFLFTIKPTAKIYVVDDFEDLKRISNIQNHLGQKTMNFSMLYDKGYDGIFVTARAESELRYGNAEYAGLDTWSVESICVFNKDVIVPIEEDAFERARINKYGEPYSDYYDEEDDFNTRDRKYLQMQSDFERYSNQNLNRDMSKLFKGKHPAILAQQHGNAKGAKLARKFNGTVQSGLD